MYFRCQILINGISYEATDDLKNWDDFELAYKRSSYDGVIRSFSTQFEFVNRSYDLLKEEFYKNYLSSKAGIVFYKRNNSWNWDEVFRCALDFSTYSEDGSVVSINAIDNTLAAIIKAKKSIQYEYLVADLQTSNLKYDGLKFQYEGKYTLGGQSYESDGVSYINIQKVFAAAGKPYFYSIPLYKLDNSELPKLDSPLRFDDVSFTEISNLNECSPFIEALSDIHVDISFRTDYYATIYAGGIQRFFLLIFKKDLSGNVTEVKSYESDGFYKYINEVIPVDLVKGESIIFATHVVFSGEMANNIDIAFPNFSFGVNFKSKINSVDIDVISPNTILSKLLDSMTENAIEYSSSIDYILSSEGISIKFNRLLERTYIMAAESARGLPKAKVYTSYKKFCEWMEAEFGYIPVINENTVTFMHRDKLFSSTVVKDLGTEINDYEFSVNDSLIYSSVKVGYDKQDYDSINGRDEFRFTNEFSTGLKLTDNTLSLISPYRADAYGIEFLVQKRGEDTTDNDSDNDVFFVECDDSVPVDQPLPLYRPYTEDQLSGLLSPDTMFNLNYSPRFMLEANKKYIGACTNLLKFASSDGNSDVSIAGVKETDDFSIPERLFTVSEVEIETSDIGVPNDLAGLISFENKGETITGYIKQLKINIGKEQATSYSLIVKNVET
jgi:hypothetical protein|nr:MAG TPA: hypothetical protein [Caudoviricetes sp.]